MHASMHEDVANTSPRRHHKRLSCTALQLPSFVASQLFLASRSVDPSLRSGLPGSYSCSSLNHPATFSFTRSAHPRLRNRGQSFVLAKRKARPHRSKRRGDIRTSSSDHLRVHLSGRRSDARGWFPYPAVAVGPSHGRPNVLTLSCAPRPARRSRAARRLRARSCMQRLPNCNRCDAVTLAVPQPARPADRSRAASASA